jgi:site-specific recombinase XerC
LILLAVSTGLRVSELVALNIGDVRNGKGVRSVVTLRTETTKGKKGGEIVLPVLTSVEKRGEVSAPAARRSRTTSALARVTSSSSSLSLSG